MSTQQETQSNNRFLSLREVVKKYPISLNSLYNWIKADKIQHRRIGNKYFIYENDLFSVSGGGADE